MSDQNEIEKKVYFGQIIKNQEGELFISTLTEDININEIEISEKVGREFNIYVVRAKEYSLTPPNFFDFIYEVGITQDGSNSNKVGELRSLFMSQSDANWINAKASLPPFLNSSEPLKVRTILTRYGPSCIASSLLEFNSPLSVDEAYNRWVSSGAHSYRLMQMHLTNGHYLYSSGGRFSMLAEKPYYELKIGKKGK